MFSFRLPCCCPTSIFFESKHAVKLSPLAKFGCCDWMLGVADASSVPCNLCRGCMAILRVPTLTMDAAGNAAGGLCGQAAGAEPTSAALGLNPLRLYSVGTFFSTFCIQGSDASRKNQTRTSFCAACCRDLIASMQGWAGLTDDGVPR